MVVAPTYRMRTLAARWLTDTVLFQTVTPAPLSNRRPFVDGITGEPTLDEGTETPALIRQEIVDQQDSTTVRRDVRDLIVWVGDGYTPTAGQRCTFLACGDPSLVNRFGEVITVERDSIRAIRRCTVRLGNDD